MYFKNIFKLCTQKKNYNLQLLAYKLMKFNYI